MVDRLNCLWHNTVIRSNYKDCDICRVCSTHTHCSKCLMSRCVEECDLFSVNLNNRCTDVLCDTTGLTTCYITVTDCIQTPSTVAKSRTRFKKRFATRGVPRLHLASS